MTAAGLVSIVIPTYNTPSSWLREAVASAQSQSYPSVEVIVVDDGSIPPVRLEGVRVVSQSNRGSGAAINTGVRASAGEYVLALGADDLIDPDTVAALHRTLTSAPDIVLAHPTVELFGTESGVMRTPDVVRLEDISLFNSLVATTLIRREHWALGGGFDEHGDCSEDWVLWATVLGRTGGKAVKAPGAVLRYRRTGTTQNVTNRAPERVQNARRHIVANLHDMASDLYLAASERGVEEATKRAADYAAARRWSRIAPIADPIWDSAVAIRRRVRHRL